MKKILLIFVLPLFLLGLTDSERAYWYDGQAELNGYELKFNRYGEIRNGTAVTIFVTEPFDTKSFVKSNKEKGRHIKTAIKLNLIEDFPTGVYDYNLMTSVFAPFDDEKLSRPFKVSFSSQEWCGQVWQQMITRGNRLEIISHSYFDGEGDMIRNMGAPRKGLWLAEDGLLLWARGLSNLTLGPGERREISLLSSTKISRLSHIQIRWEAAEISRGAKSISLKVPLGEFQVETFEVKLDNNAFYVFYVETDAPRRVIKWELKKHALAHEAILVGTSKMKYWEMNQELLRNEVTRLGLTPRPPRTP